MQNPKVTGAATFGILTADMLEVGESTVQRTFVAWIVFLETIFNCINLKPEAGFF